jgi:hypothetical protein
MMGTGSDVLGPMVVGRKKKKRGGGGGDGKRGGFLRETRANEGGAGTVGGEREKYGTKERRHGV